jgi:MarR family transcriptional regulator, organic hydroperoxide resistance regulator
MQVELAKRMMDACYQAKRIRELLPVLPEGVTSSYIHYLDVIEVLEQKGQRAKVSDISDALHLPRPGVTRTVKEMEQKGYIRKVSSEEDGRVTYLAITAEGKELSGKYNRQCFDLLTSYLRDIPEEDVETMIRTIGRVHQIMCERRIHLED